MTNSGKYLIKKDMGKSSQNLNRKQEPELTGYALSRRWFDFALENSEKIRPVNVALYFWLCELYNRLGRVKKFGVPTETAMAAIGVSNFKTYKKAFESLVEWGFIEVIEKSRNQYTATTISLKYSQVADTKSPEFALVKNTIASPEQITEQMPKQSQVTASINKPINSKRKETLNLMSEVFTPHYNPINKYDDIAYKLWNQVYKNLTAKKIKPTTLLNAKIKEWANEIQLLIERDERTEIEINEVLQLINENDFWAKNILSASKLRQQFERLLVEARTHHKIRPQQNDHSIGNDQNLSEAMNYNIPLNKV